MNRNTLIRIVATAITLFFIILLFTQVSAGDIIEIISQINPWLLASAFILYVGCYFFRTIRFYYLLNKEISVVELFSIVCIHNLVNQILPAKTGEMSYIYLIKKIHHRPAGEGIATLFLARVFDIISISVLFLISFIFVVPSLITNQGVFYTVIGTLVLLIGLLVLFLNRARSCLEMISGFLSFVHADTTKIGDFIIKKGTETVAALERSGAGGYLFFGVIFGLSCGIWGAMYSYTIILVTAMNLHLPILFIIFACSFGFMTAILPVQGIGNFGSFEAGWTAGFLSIGVPVELAISSGFGFHIISLLFTLLLGAFGFFSTRRFHLKITDDTND
jgi:glycosyltransferase 2 family protein